MAQNFLNTEFAQRALAAITIGKHAGRHGTVESNGYRAMLDTEELVTVRQD